ncbi:protein FAM45A [Lingula anatina]|uniref:Protein FAM45A n=1 Tax=Lingula anatina TaxID=7574 RepID=A0A1S3H0N0_LINAN|nr:protein FAM45A [Lingula anatina]|eukprot:XP_013378729.1 protein FAM45A [Lingula anatina]
MAALCDLLCAGLIEKDSNGDVLWTWSYPSVTENQRNLFIRKSRLQGETYTDFLYGQYKHTWYYIKTVSAADLVKVTHFSLVLVSKDFNPEKYQALCNIMCQLYKNTGNPASMLESYLAVVTKGACNGEENGKFTVSDFDARQAYIQGSLKDVINMFGVETIVIYTALLLKKRIAVLHPNVETLLSFMRVLPALVWHRQNWGVLHPYVDLEEDELEDLRASTPYIAGFTDAAVEGRNELYDIFVAMTTREITIAPQAKESLAMGKLHKDIAMFMVQCADNDDMGEQQVIKEISVKTKELLNNLKSLATVGEDDKPYISFEILQGRKMPPATQNFLYNLAAAEGMVKF